MSYPYATAADYARRAGVVLTSDEEARVESLIEDAASTIESLGFEASTDELERSARVVVLNMVGRVMSMDGVGSGVTQSSLSAGGFSQSYTYANSTETMYVSKQERKMLRIAGGVRTIMPDFALGGTDD